ncbi:helix-turn-helix DNA binding domain protein [Streptomyces phage Wakanda]|uniref:Helix-turn-helix DNA binding domain protein n=1 Tax=Streptomyces phage Wakanda TaxID=2713267 RepID=A0A6G8R1K6_9CAUD|nr:helix-turn-helix DNA binding domain protein [Streptomyces phage Wakanda]QIN94063.1 helix-turn-helix DNA binding domain protein [Streptomyces phage Wakanda]
MYDSYAWMRKRFLVDKKTPEEIAKECGVSHMTIYRKLQAHGLIKKR